MTSSFKIAAGAIAGLVMWASTAAADEKSRFSGAYVGGNIGYQYGILDVATYHSATGTYLGNFGAVRPSGVNGGIQAGYNLFPLPWLLAGIEADIQFSDAEDEHVTATGVRTKAEFGTFGSIRARLGMPVTLPTGPGLLYSTIGVGFTRIEYSGVTPGGTAYASENTRTGIVLGTGLEWALGRHWSVKSEGLYFGTGNHDIAAANGTVTSETQSFLLYRFGINYKF
jgi:opacity protein-like surface antigen